VESFEKTGLWWLPSHPDQNQKLHGTLEYSDDRGLILKLLGAFESPVSFTQATKYPLIFGSLDNADGCSAVTLVNSFQSKRQFGSHTRTSEEVRAGRCFLGAHLLTPEDFQFKQARFELSKLGSWIDKSGFVDRTIPDERGSSIRIAYRFPEHIQETFDGVKVDFVFTAKLEGPYNRQAAIRETVSMNISIQGSLTTDELIRRYIYPLQNFVSLATDRPSAVLRLDLMQNSEPEADSIRVVTQPVYKYTEDGESLFPYHMLFTLSDVRAHLGATLDRWLRFSVDCPGTCSSYFAILYGTWSFLEIKFLAYCQVLDTYRRERGLLSPQISRDAETLAGICAKLDLSEQEWLNQKLTDIDRFADVLTFLVARHWDAFGPVAGGTEDEFVTAIQKARHEANFSPGILADRAEQFYWLMQRLSMLIKILLLTELGFDVDMQRRFLTRNEHYANLRRRTQ
jgi:hypothetical protein